MYEVLEVPMRKGKQEGVGKTATGPESGGEGGRSDSVGQQRPSLQARTGAGVGIVLSPLYRRPFARRQSRPVCRARRCQRWLLSLRCRAGEGKQVKATSRLACSNNP